MLILLPYRSFANALVCTQYTRLNAVLAHRHRLCAHLVLASGSLASLQLLQVPVANLHVATVVIHALGELLRYASAVVAPLLLLLLVGLGSLDLLRSRLK